MPLMMRLKILIKPFNSIFINSIMNKQIINEITRISTLMGVKPLITEQAIPKAVKSLLSLSDDIVKKFYKVGNNVTDNLLRKVRNGESLSDDAIELLLRNIDFAKLSKILIDNKSLGTNFDNFIDSTAVKISNNPNSTQSMLSKFDTFIDSIPFLDDAPEELITSLKSEARERILREAELNTKKLKIFNPKNWGDLITLTEDEIEELVNLGIWDKVVLQTESLFKPNKERLRSIQQLAKSIQNTSETNTELLSQIEVKLKKELEWLYKKNTNNFVSMRNYFDKIAETDVKWKKIWNNIKSQSDGGWDFYKSFGTLAEHVKPFKRIWGGITSDLKVLIETEKKIISKTVNKLAKKEITKAEVIGNFWENFKSGSRRGFPTMSNEKYKKIIQLYGPLGAKASYFRDVVITTLKWNFYVGFLVTLRNFIANSAYEDNIQRCISTNDIKSKECTDLNENYFTKKMAEWSLKYRENPQKSSDFVKNWILEIFSVNSNLPELVKGDIWYKQVSEILTLDPGIAGQAVNMVTSILNINDNPERKKELLDSIDKQIKLGQENLKKAEDEVEDAINNVDISVIENTPVGFKAFIIKSWGSDYKISDKFGKQGNEYTVNDGVNIYYYIYEGTTFKNTKITDLSGNILKNQ
jgi:hypothetical protein